MATASMAMAITKFHVAARDCDCCCGDGDGDHSSWLMKMMAKLLFVHTIMNCPCHCHSDAIMKWKKNKLFICYGSVLKAGFHGSIIFGYLINFPLRKIRLPIIVILLVVSTTLWFWHFPPMLG